MHRDEQDQDGRRLSRSGSTLPVETGPHWQLVERGTPYVDEDDEISLMELWLTIVKYKWTIISFTALVVGATIIGTALMRPVYKSTSTIQIDLDAPRILEYQKLDNDGNSVNQRNFYATQYEILKSRSLAGDVINELDLMHNPEINGEIGQRGILAGMGQLLGVIRGVFASNSGDSSPAAQRSNAIDRFLDRLVVTPVRDSKLVNVSFESFDPALAASVTNTLVQQYIKTNLQRHYDSGTQAREFLKQQLGEMQANLERADRALQDFARKQGIADLESHIKLANDKLASLQEKLTDVQQRKVELQIKNDRIQAGKGDDLPEIVSSDLIGKLQEELVKRRSEYSELLAQFKPQYPSVLELKNRIDQLQAQIQDERNYIQQGIISQYEGLVDQEKALNAAIQQQEQRLLSLNQSSVQYNILKREVDTNKELYDGLLQRMKEIGVAAGVRENNVAVIDAARKAIKPFEPSLRFNALMALIFGTFGGTGIAFFLQFLDNTVRRPEDIEELVDLPSLGLVPHVALGKGKQARDIDPRELAFYSVNQRQSEISEAYRSLRTSLTFSSPEGMPRTLLVTSTGPGEGKTTTASNLACVLAQNGKRTLLVDADLRKAQLHKYYNKAQVPGLTQRITRRDYTTNSFVHETEVENLFVLTSGTIPPNPAELLAPERVAALIAELTDAFDHIIVDSAPVLGLADALVLSRSVEAVMLIVYGGKTTKEALRFTVRRLRQVRAPLVGAVLNNVDLESPDYNYYSGSYYYSYNADHTEEPQHALEDDQDKGLGRETA